jgi:hypothetical protein
MGTYAGIREYWCAFVGHDWFGGEDHEPRHLQSTIQPRYRTLRSCERRKIEPHRLETRPLGQFLISRCLPIRTT